MWHGAAMFRFAIDTIHTIHRGRPRPFWLDYSSVHVGKSLLWAGEDALTLYMLTRFVALPPAIAGMLFLASSLWNALCDGAIGAAMQRFPGLQRRLPGITWAGVVVAGLGFAALPMMPPGKVLPAALLLLAFRTAYALVDVPHNGLTRHIAGDGQSLQAARIRSIGSAAATLAIGVSCALLLGVPGDGRMVPTLAVAVIGTVALLLMLPLPGLVASAPATKAAHHREPPATALWLFCAATMLGLVGLGAIGKALLHLHYATTGVASAVAFIVVTGRLAGVWIWLPVARRVGQRTGLGLAYGACGLAALLLPAFVSASGWGVVLPAALLGVAAGGVAMLGWAVLLDVSAARRDRPAGDASAFALFTMGMKIALGLSAALVGTWLSHNGASVAVAPDRLWPLALSVAAATWAAGILIAGGPFRAQFCAGVRRRPAS